MDDVLQNSAEGYEPRGRLDPAGFTAHVKFRTFAPADDLVPFVEHFWSVRWEGQDHPYRSEEVMHRPYVDVFVSAEESGIQGTFRGKKDYWASGSGRILGARFLPGAFHVFSSRPMTAIQDQVLRLEEIFPAADRAAVREWLGRDDEGVVGALTELLRAARPLADENVALIAEIIEAVETGRLTTVAAVAREFLRSELWLQQLFRDYLGMGAKWLIQRQRLLAAARRIREGRPAWAELAYETGYSSQQHFITDFRRVVGKTPAEYENALRPPRN